WCSGVFGDRAARARDSRRLFFVPTVRHAMRAILGCTMTALLMFSAGLAADDKKEEKIDAKKLIGKWEPGEAKKDVDMVIEFAEKGKLTLAVKLGDKTEKIEGTYKLEGNKLSLALSFGGQEQKETLTVHKL